MSNLSQMKRDKMLEFLEKIRIEHRDETSLIAINEIENALTEKKYGLVWEEHEEAVDVMIETHIPVFTEISNKEIKGNSADNCCNFLLEGDNLHSLKLLEKTHRSRIDVIYIDPPYNLGSKDFKYDDTYLDSTDAFRHSKWCSFMYKRLQLARTLLSDDGAIFISIDDNEQAALKLLCDEIFGNDNFVANVIWEKKFSPQNDAKWLSDNHDFVVIYAKNKEKWHPNLLERTDDMNARYKNPDNDPRGVWTSGDFSVKTYNANMDYPITTPSGRVVNPPAGYCWRFSKETYERMIKENRVWFGEKGDNVPRVKRFLSDVKQGTVCKTIWGRKEVGDTQEGTRDMKLVFDGEAPFTNPKPLRLIYRILDIASKEDSIVLDFFAGSGTTGQSVINYNNLHGGNRKFILCTDNTVSDKEKKKFLGDVPDGDFEKYLETHGICSSVTHKRLKNTICGSENREGILSNVKYYKTEYIVKSNESEYYSVSEELQKHIKEMVQLEKGVSIEDDNYILLLSDEEADELEKNPDRLKNCKGIYISSGVFLTDTQEKMLKDIPIETIPDYFFESELREVGEL